MQLLLLKIKTKKKLIIILFRLLRLLRGKKKMMTKHTKLLYAPTDVMLIVVFLPEFTLIACALFHITWRILFHFYRHNLHVIFRQHTTTTSVHGRRFFKVEIYFFFPQTCLNAQLILI